MLSFKPRFRMFIINGTTKKPNAFSTGLLVTIAKEFSDSNNEIISDLGTFKFQERLLRSVCTQTKTRSYVEA